MSGGRSIVGLTPDWTGPTRQNFKKVDDVKMMSTDITIDPNSPHVKFGDLGIKPTPVEKVRTLTLIRVLVLYGFD